MNTNPNDKLEMVASTKTFNSKLIVRLWIFSLAIIALLALILLSSETISADPVTLQPGPEGKDATTLELDPNSNYGNYNSLIMGCYGMAEYEADVYIQFDLSTIPEGSTVTYTRLELYCDYAPISRAFYLHQVTSSWSETGITYNNAPTCNPTHITYTTVDNTGWFLWNNLQNLVQIWVDGSSNNGMIIKPHYTGSDGADEFRSSDYPTESYRPKLYIEYTPPDPPTPPDSYEVDNVYTQAKSLSPGSTQTHSIHNDGSDIDWVYFTLSQKSDVVIETSGPSGDTRIWLYDSSGVPSTYIAYDDDGGSNQFSKITQAGVSVGTYYVKIDEYNNNADIPTYYLDLTVTPVTPVPALSTSLTSLPVTRMKIDDTSRINIKIQNNGESINYMVGGHFAVKTSEFDITGYENIDNAVNNIDGDYEYVEWYHSAGIPSGSYIDYWIDIQAKSSGSHYLHYRSWAKEVTTVTDWDPNDDGSQTSTQIPIPSGSPDAPFYVWTQSIPVNTKPPTPTLQSPVDEATLAASSSQTVSWNSVTDADGDSIAYHWYVDTDDPPTAPYAASGSTVGTASSEFTTTEDTTYYWRVYANDGYEYSDPSSTWRFEAKGSITVRGYIWYWNQNEASYEGVNMATVKLYDAEVGDDDWLGTTSTDDFGYYEFDPVINDDGWLQGGLDVYVKVWTESDAVEVKDASSTWYIDQTSQLDNVPSGTVNIPTRYILDEDSTSWYIMDIITDGYSYADSHDGGSSPPQASVTWFPGFYPGAPAGPHGSAFANPDGGGDGRIYIDGEIDYRDHWDVDVLLHEYGHFVMYHYAKGAVPTGANGNWDSHTTDQGYAWREGWATFFSCAVQDSLDYDNWYLDTIWRNKLETTDENWWRPDGQGWTYTDNNLHFTSYLNPTDPAKQGDDIEGCIAGLLWDIFDASPNFDDDQNSDGIIDELGVGISNIWDVFDNYQTGGHSCYNIHDFWDGWFALGYSDRAELNAIYWEHGIDKNNPPTISITSPTGWHSGEMTISATGVSDIDGTVQKVDFEFSLDNAVWYKIGEDTNSGDGWSIIWDTNQLVEDYGGIGIDGYDDEIWVRAIAYDGMEERSQISSSFGVDNALPNTPTVSETHCGGSHSGWPAWSCHGSPYFTWNDPGDDGSGVDYYEVQVDGGLWTTVSSPWHPTYGNGEYTIDFRAVDKVGLIGGEYGMYVKIDTTPPAVTDNQVGDDYWRNSAGTTYDVDFSDPNSLLDYAQYKITTSTGQGGTVLKDWTYIFNDLGLNSYTTDWQIDFSACQEGLNYISVRAYDYAGNITTKDDVFCVRKDTTLPVVTNNQIGDDTWRIAGGTTYDTDFSDPTSLLNYSQYKITTSVGQGGTVLKGWTNIFDDLGQNTYTTDWQIDFSACSMIILGMLKQQMMCFM